MPDLLELKNISCAYGDRVAVAGLSLTLRENTLNCLLGPSGCGKTTVLRAVAGFENLGEGEIILGGETISAPGHLLPPERRGIGIVFQDYALFPHLTAAANVAFGLRDMTKTERRKTAAAMLELVGLETSAWRYPHELSGGEQQRVAVARALAPRPPLLLMDEPFSSLDIDLRERLALDVREILKQRQTTTLFVTHDQAEAFIIGERVAVMNNGRMMQWGAPYTLYHKPANRFVADFIGQGRLVGGAVSGGGAVTTALGVLRGNHSHKWPKDTMVDVLLRPDDVLLGVADGVECRITDRHFLGAQFMYTLRAPGDEELLSLMPSHFDMNIGQQVKAGVDAKHLVMFRR